MAFTFTLTTLVALASFSGSAFAAPSPIANGENIAARAACVSTIYSAAGDTCAKIAAKNGLTAADIQNANTFLNCDDIWTNTPICIVASTTTTTPTCASTYNSVAGETCDTLASKFGVTTDAIKAANSFLTCNDIWANTPICVPSGGSTSTPTCSSTYTSVSGDTCDKIGTKFGLASSAIQNANSFLNCNDIWSNTPICIPPGGTTNNGGSSSTSSCVMTYIAESNDSCNSLANDFGVSASSIQNANSFLNCNDIWSGTPLCIPTGGRVSTPQAGSASNCVVSYNAAGNENCDQIGAKFGLEGWEIQNANSFVNCNDIWSGTSLCIVSGC